MSPFVIQLVRVGKTDRKSVAVTARIFTILGHDVIFQETPKFREPTSNSENFRTFTRFIYLRLFWFRVVYLRPRFVYLHFQCLLMQILLCIQTRVCLFTFSMFIYGISALFTNTGLFIYICICLHRECKQTCRRHVARFLEI